MSGTRRTKQEVVSEYRCAEILESARKVFAAKGFSHATMDEIAAAAGLAKGTLYLYFDSKQEIYLKALQHGITEMVELAGMSMQAVEGSRPKLHRFLSTRAKYAEANRDFYKIYQTEFGNIIHPATINRKFRELYNRQADAIEQVLCEAMKDGEIRPVPARAVALTILDMSRSLIVRRLLGWSKADVEEDIDLLCELIWKGIAC